MKRFTPALRMTALALLLALLLCAPAAFADTATGGEADPPPQTVYLDIGISCSVDKDAKTISVTVTEATEGERVLVFSDQLSGQNKFLSKGGSHTFTVPAAGDYLLRARYENNADVAWSKTVTVEEPAPAVLQPALSLSADGDTLTATVSNASERTVFVDVYLDGEAVDGNGTDGNGTCTFSGLAKGTYTVKAYYKDAVEGIETVSKSIDVPGKTSEPETPAQTVTYAQFTADAQVSGKTITATVSGGTADAELFVDLYKTGTGFIARKTLSASGSVSFDELSAGEYRVIVNYTAEPEGVTPFIVNKVVEETPVTEPEPARQFSMTTESSASSVKVTIADASSLELLVGLYKENGDVVETKTLTGSGSVTFEVTASGVYEIRANYNPVQEGVNAQTKSLSLEAAPPSAETVKQFDVTLEGGKGTLSITVSGASSRNLTVVIKDADGNMVGKAYLYGDSKTTMNDLPEGEYTVVVDYTEAVTGIDAVSKTASVQKADVPETPEEESVPDVKFVATTGVGKIEAEVTEAGPYPVTLMLTPGNVAKTIDGGKGKVTFDSLAAGTYTIVANYNPDKGAASYTIKDLVVAAKVKAITITQVVAGQNQLVVTGTAQPASDITLTTEPASTPMIVRSDAQGTFVGAITCSAGTYTAVHAQYGSDTASRDSVTGSYKVTAPASKPTLYIDEVDNNDLTSMVKTTAGLVVQISTGDYTQRSTADSSGIARFTLPHDYPTGTKLTFTVYYGSNQTLTENYYVVSASHYYLLKKGSTGSDVKRLTKRLADLGYPISQTSRYDDAVVSAVRLFQKANGLSVDGQAGELTQRVLYSVSAIAYGSSAYPTLVRGDKGLALIYTLQERLKDLGYYTIRVDGIFGSGTQRAVRWFQQVNGLSITGVADDATQRLLYSSSAKAASGSAPSSGGYTTLSRSKYYNSAVVTLQRRLKALGYYAGSVDGYFGSQTYRAVRNFQSRNSLSITGVADALTQQTLYSSSAKAASGSSSSSSSSSSSTSTGYRLLYWGCKGDAVVRLQNALISAGYKSYVRTADGIYGQWTYDAVCAFQKDRGLAVDGIAGKKTQNALYGTSY